MTRRADGLDALAPTGRADRSVARTSGSSSAIRTSARRNDTRGVELRSGPAILPAGSPLPAPRSDPGRDMSVPWCRAAVRARGGRRERAVLTGQRGERTRSTCRFRIGRVPMTDGSRGSSSTTADINRSRWWSACGWAHRQEAGVMAAVLETTEGGGHPALRPHRGHPVDESVQHVTYLRRRRAPPGRVPASTEMEWERACAWDPAGGGRAGSLGGSESTAIWRASAAGTTARTGRRLSAGARPTARNRCWRRVGVDEFAVRPGPASADAVRRYSHRSSNGDFRVLRGGSWAVAPGSCGPASATGTTPSGGRSSRLRLAWEDVPALGWLGEPRSVASLVLDPPYGLLVQSYAPRRQNTA